MCYDAIASSFVTKVHYKGLAHALDVKENNEHALDFAVGEFGLFHWEDFCFISGSYLQIQLSSLMITLAKKVVSSHKILCMLAVPLLDPLQCHIRPDPQL
jgi:hypothetical protein